MAAAAVLRPVLPDLFLQRVGRFAVQSNTQVYVFRLGDTLIDTGSPNQWPAVRAFVAATTAARPGRTPPRRALVTHHHEDHAGNGARLQRELGVPVAVPPLTAPLVREDMVQEYYRRIIWGRYEPFEPQGGVLAEEEALPELGPGVALRVVHAPGHIGDHHCFHLPSRGWLFTADLFVARRRMYYRKDEDASVELDSLRRVLQLDFDTLLCSHRGVVPDGKAALAERVAFMEEVRARTRELRARGLPPAAIRKQLLGAEGLMRYLTMHDFSKQRFIDTIA